MPTLKTESLAAERRLDAAHGQSGLDTHVVWRREVHVFQHGEYFDSYLATEPGREEFWSSTGEGLISYTRRGRYGDRHCFGDRYRVR